MHDKIPPPSLYHSTASVADSWKVRNCIISPCLLSIALATMEMSVLNPFSHFFNCLCLYPASPKACYIPHFWCTTLSWLHCIQTSNAHIVEGTKNCSSWVQSNTSTSLISQYQTTPDSWEERAHPQSDQHWHTFGGPIHHPKGSGGDCSLLGIRGEKGKPPRMAMPLHWRMMWFQRSWTSIPQVIISNSGSIQL